MIGLLRKSNYTSVLFYQSQTVIDVLPPWKRPNIYFMSALWPLLHGKLILPLLISFTMIQLHSKIGLSHTSYSSTVRIIMIMHISSSSLSSYGVCGYTKMNVFLRTQTLISLESNNFLTIVASTTKVP